jgi:hypothetical protein
MITTPAIGLPNRRFELPHQAGWHLGGRDSSSSVTEVFKQNWFSAENNDCDLTIGQALLILETRSTVNSTSNFAASAF